MTPAPDRLVASYDVVVPAGGQARRMGGRDKTRIRLGGQPLLDRVLAAAGPAAAIVVVGEQRPTARPVRWQREDPPGGGPAAAVGAALPLLAAPATVLLAADLPLLDSAAPALLLQVLAAAPHVDGVVAVDRDGREQWLTSAWRLGSLRRTAGLTAGGSLRRTLGALRWRPVTFETASLIDCDTPDDLRRVRELTG